MGGSSPPLAIAQDEAPVRSDSVTSNAGVAPPPKPKKRSRAPRPVDRGEDRQTTKDASAKDGGKTQPTLEELVKQCETAATRGDCPAVRVLAQRILTRSGGSTRAGSRPMPRSSAACRRRRPTRWSDQNSSACGPGRRWSPIRSTTYGNGHERRASSGSLLWRSTYARTHWRVAAFA